MVTDWTYEALPAYELDVDYEQTWTHERRWHSTHPKARITADIGLATDGLAITSLSYHPYKIEGVTVDQNEDPIAGATVFLLRGSFLGFTLVQTTISDGSGNYLFYVEDPTDEYVVISWKWDAGLGEYIRGVTDRDLTAVAC